MTRAEAQRRGEEQEEMFGKHNGCSAKMKTPMAPGPATGCRRSQRPAWGPPAGGRAASRAARWPNGVKRLHGERKERILGREKTAPVVVRKNGSRGRSPWYVPPGVIHRLRLRENEPILVGAETEPVGNCSGEGGTGGEPGRHLPGALISDVDRKRPDLVDLDQDVACCIAPVCKVAKGFRSGEPQSKEAWP